jgi:hypothetical protein
MLLKTIANFKIMIIFDLQYVLFMMEIFCVKIFYFLFLLLLLVMVIFINKSKQNL